MAFDLEKFNRQVYQSTTETVDQQIDKFNEQSGGCILLSPSDANQGDFSMTASFKLMSGLVRRRDVNNGTKAVGAIRLQHLKNTSVKVAAGTPPINFERAQYDWIKQNSAQAALTIGEQLARAMLADELNVAISALAGSIGNQSVLVQDISAMSPVSFDALAETAGLFGDRMMAIKTWVLHSKCMTDLFRNALKNAEQLFEYGTVNVLRDPFGRIFVVTDSPALKQGAKYNTLGLVQGAALVEPNNDFRAILDETTGTENIQTSYQAEWSYNVGLFGYGWNTAAGGAAPNDTALATGTNWTKTATSVKDTAGVMLISQ